MRRLLFALPLVLAFQVPPPPPAPDPPVDDTIYVPYYLPANGRAGRAKWLRVTGLNPDDTTIWGTLTATPTDPKMFTAWTDATTVALTPNLPEGECFVDVLLSYTDASGQPATLSARWRVICYQPGTRFTWAPTGMRDPAPALFEVPPPDPTAIVPNAPGDPP